MLLFEESLKAKLVALATTALGRWYAVTLPQPPEYPAGAYSCVPGGLSIESQEGASGLYRLEVDLDCYGRTYPDAKRLARQVRRGLELHPRQRPLVEDGPLVGGIKMGTDQDDYDPVGQTYVITIPASFWHERDVA